MDEIEEKLEAMMTIYNNLPDEDKKKIEAYTKFILYFKEFADHIGLIRAEDVEKGEIFVTINKHLRAIIREFKKMEEE